MADGVIPKSIISFATNEKILREACLAINELPSPESMAQLGIDVSQAAAWLTRYEQITLQHQLPRFIPADDFSEMLELRRVMGDPVGRRERRRLIAILKRCNDSGQNLSSVIRNWIDTGEYC